MTTKENKKILIVDDSQINRELLRRIFMKEYGILLASNGKEALEIIERERKSISVILLDIVMPEMDGYKVLEELGRKKYLHFIPVIMITGDNSSEVEVKCLEMGAVDFINKPFEPKVAFRRVCNAIELYQHKNQLEILVSIQVESLRI